MNSVRTIFAEALEIKDAQKRAGFVSQACAGDPIMREEIEGLLEAVSEAGSFLPERLAAGEGVATLFQEASREEGVAVNMAPAGKLGERIGRYKLLQKVGEGGCGVVYMAEQEEPVRRRVALKVIKLGMDTKQVIARFEAERQALALMDHPNIAKVLDGGDDGSRSSLLRDGVGAWGQDHWDRVPPVKESGSALVVWNGSNRQAARQMNAICLFKSTRANPRPEVAIASIDFISTMTEGAPFLVALTVE
jgi:hypothetical protein